MTRAIFYTKTSLRMFSFLFLHVHISQSIEAKELMCMTLNNKPINFNHLSFSLLTSVAEFISSKILHWLLMFFHKQYSLIPMSITVINDLLTDFVFMNCREELKS